MQTNSATVLTQSPSQIVFDLDALLIDTIQGVRHALGSVARLRRRQQPRILSYEDIRARSLSSIVADIAGTDDPELIAEMTAHYWRVYEQESRYRAPLLPGAYELIEALGAQGMQLHYVSSYDPEVATRLVHRHGLQHILDTVYAPPKSICACPGARATLFQNFIAGREHAAHEFLLISDSAMEIFSAMRLGVPSLALRYGGSYLAPALESANGVLGVARSPRDVTHWLRAHQASRDALLVTSQRASSRLH